MQEKPNSATLNDFEAKTSSWSQGLPSLPPGYNKDAQTEGTQWSILLSRLEDICTPSNSNKPALEQDLNENIFSLAASSNLSN